MIYLNSNFKWAALGKWGLAAGTVLATGLLGSQGALAQSCGNLTLTGNSGGAPYAIGGTIAAIGSGISAGNAIAGAVQAANTAFLTQSTAFVSAPGNPPANSEGAGVWFRNVGGELDLKSTTQVSGSIAAVPANPGLGTPAFGQGTGSTTCNSTFHQTFAGFQLGQDVAKLNFAGGWNLHLGTTAGFLETSGNVTQGNILGGTFNSTTQAPFLGSYAVLTKGDFYVDGLIRYDYFQTDLNSPTANIFDQKVDAHGWTLAASTGYNYKIPNSKWFVEPSLGVVWSKETIGAINTTSPLAATGFFAAFNYSGTAQPNDIDTFIGRAGVRVGTLIETSNLVLQPFVAASVWHDFSGDITASYSSCPNCFFVNGLPSALAAHLSTNNIGTFGQYSLGISGQVLNTGWLGFARVDYRDGPNMNGLSGTGGIRYQFTPGQAPVYPVKAPVYKAPDLINWAGLYVGAIGGAQYGRSDMYFPTSGYSFLVQTTTVVVTGGAQVPGGSAANMRSAGVLGGGTLGYNWQSGGLVYGIEGDFSGTNAQGSSQCQPLNPPLVPMIGSVNNSLFQTTCHNSLDWTATVTGRLGYTWLPHTLTYAKAGLAIGEESFSETCNLGPLNGTNGATFTGPIFQQFQNCVNANGAFVNSASANALAVGWTVGYGAEFAFNQHWTAKAEFDWLDFGRKSLTLSDGSAISTRERAAQGKIGVNYKF
jgi:opacity protein-like surface antigen